MSFDVEATLSKIFGALKAEAGNAWSNITPFARSSLRGLAEQTALIAQARIENLYTDAKFTEKMAGIEKQARIIAKAVAELVQISLIKAKNAILDILKGAARTALQTSSLGFLIP